jgi:DNA-binding PadR family transcriptional regulator
LHILYHAAKEPIFGLGIIEELARYGYRISAGTLYPILHGMETRGYMRSREELIEGRYRRVYIAMPLGKRALAAAKVKVSELFGELFEDEPSRIPK